MKKLSKILIPLLLCVTVSVTSSTVAYTQADNARTTQSSNDDDDQDWGWIGLLGLAGLLGLRRTHRDDRYDRDTVNKGTRV